MRQLLLLTAAVFLLMSWGSCFAAETKSDAVLESISYEKDDNNAEKIVFKLNGAHIPKVFQIKGERPRIVFDFIDTRYSDLINRIIDTKGDLIEGVRVGIHNDPPKTRVVIDLKPEGDFRVEQDFLVRENTLSITFHPNQSDGQKEPEVPDMKDSAVPSPPAASQPQTAPAVTAAPAAAAVVTPDPVARNVEPPPPKPDEPQIKAAETTLPSAPEKQSSAAAPQTGAAPAAEQKPDLIASAAPAETAAPAQESADNAAAASAAPAAAADPVLRDVSFETTADNSEMVLFKLNDFYPPIVFGIEKGNPRVVCDFLDTALDKGVRSSIETKGNYISGIRVARHNSPNKVRVVLDLVPNRNYDLQQVFFKEDNLFIIIINEFEEEPVPAADLTGGAAPPKS